MPRPLKPFILSCVIIVATAFPSLAQVTNTPAADTNSVAASPAPTGQAPDDVTKKLSDLIHAGKYTEAQQLIPGLLLAYPDDQRLTKAKTLLDKLLAAAKPADIVTGNSQPTNSVAQPTTEQLTGMDKVEYNSLIELGKEAQQTTDLDQQKTLLHQFMDKSKPFLEKHPNDLLLWQLRAASAISLNDPLAGYEAGQKLLASGNADTEPAMQRLLSQLNLKGWLDKQKVEEKVEAQKKSEDFIKRYGGSYSVIGEVKNPGNIVYQEEMKEMTVAKAIQAAGGLTDFAKNNVLILTRGDSGKRTTVFYKKVSDLSIYPGDKIEVLKGSVHSF